MPNRSHRDLIAVAAPTHERKTALCAVLPTDGNKGHPSRMSIGASAISGMTMGRLHAVMGSRWRRTARIASKSAFLARRRDGAVWTARTGQTERGPQQMLTDAQQHATGRFAKSLLALSDDALIDTYQQALDDHRAARAEGSDNLTKAYAQTLATEKAMRDRFPDYRTRYKVRYP